MTGKENNVYWYNWVDNYNIENTFLHFNEEDGTLTILEEPGIRNICHFIVAENGNIVDMRRISWYLVVINDVKSKKPENIHHIQYKDIKKLELSKKNLKLRTQRDDLTNPVTYRISPNGLCLVKGREIVFPLYGWFVGMKGKNLDLRRCSIDLEFLRLYKSHINWYELKFNNVICLYNSIALYDMTFWELVKMNSIIVIIYNGDINDTKSLYDGLGEISKKDNIHILYENYRIDKNGKIIKSDKV